jgi:anti-sigma-K factor RskA
MSEPKDLHDLVGEELSGEELARLRRVHELLLAAGPPPELSPTLERAPTVGETARREGRPFFLPQRRLGAALLAAAAVAALAFGAGYLTGHAGRGFQSERTVVMRGTALARQAVASIEIGSTDKGGNIPMLVHVRGLSKLPARGYYEVFLTKRRRPVVSCGTFKVKGSETTSFRLSIPYSLKRYDGWVVTRERVGRPKPGPVVLSTFTA